MRKRILILTSVLLLCGGCFNLQIDADSGGAGGDNIDQTRLLRHVVGFAFKAGTSAETIKRTEEAFCRMAERIEYIHDFEWGRNVEAHNRNRGFTHCFVLTFRSRSDLEAYQAHPIHVRLKNDAVPNLEKLLVIDYWKE